MKYLSPAALLVLFLLTQFIFLKCRSDEIVRDRKYTNIQWNTDLDSLVSYMTRTHPDLYWKTPKEVFDKQVMLIKSGIPRKTDNQIIVSFSQLVSLAKDGHTLFMGSNISDKYFQVRIESFIDGYFITAVSKKYSELYGERVIKIGNLSSAAAFNKIGSATSGDNYYSKLYWSSRNLTMSSILNGLGITVSPDILTLEIIDKTNKLRTISVGADKYPFKDDMFHSWFWNDNAVPDSNYISLVSNTRREPPLRLKNFKNPYWFEYIENHKTLYFCFNSCESTASDPFPDFIRRLWDVVDSKKPEKLIIDLRNNSGGTNDYLQPLIHGIIRHDGINRKGHLFVITSRKTFSAAMHCATWIERNSQSIFAGEPTGAAPNHYADPNLYVLPNSKLLLLVSTAYWQNSRPDDKREWIEPEIKVEIDSKDYFNGTDRTLESIYRFNLDTSNIVKRNCYEK